MLRLVRSQKKRLPLINRIPPEVLALIPDYWSADVRAQATIALTHVCRAWREIFTSRSALWTDFDCEDTDKTLVYLDRSGSSPVNLQLERYENLSPYDPFLQVIPHIITRLKSVTIHGIPESIQDVVPQLSPLAPLLESLTIVAKYEYPQQHGPSITTKFFGGDLSSLRELHLRCIPTELPWRGMVNLTSFTLAHTSSMDSSVGRLLDFFEGAPHLRKIQLRFATPTFGTQRGRLVSLRCLKRMEIIGDEPPSLLLDHLLIPVGATLVGALELRGALTRFLELSRFRIHVHVRELCPSIEFSGVGGRITVVSETPRATTTCRVLESLAQLDLPKIERLTLAGGDLMQQSGCTIYRVLSPINHLRALTISQCQGLSRFIDFLDDVAMLPTLEELVLDARVDGKTFDMQRMMEMVQRRASMFVKLKSVRIASRDKSVQTSALKLREYVPHVECSPWVALVSDDTDSSDEED